MLPIKKNYLLIVIFKGKKKKKHFHHGLRGHIMPAFMHIKCQCLVVSISRQINANFQWKKLDYELVTRLPPHQAVY